MDDAPLDLFQHKHAEFLGAISRAWVCYDHEHQELELFIEIQSSLPPGWLLNALFVKVTDLDGSRLTPLDLEWTDFSGNVLRAVARAIPGHFRPPRGERVAPVGDLIFFAGERERTLPNFFLPGEETDDDSRDDRRL